MSVWEAGVASRLTKSADYAVELVGQRGSFAADATRAGAVVLGRRRHGGEPTIVCRIRADSVVGIGEG